MVANIKPISTATSYLLRYEYNCEMIYGRVKLFTKAFTKYGSGVLHRMEFTNVDYSNIKGMIAYLKYQTSE